MSQDQHAEKFNEYRPFLFSIAYRMLGSVMDADDIVQEAFLRWLRASPDEVQSPRAYLASVVTRLCIDQERSARAQHEVYVGPWLPEPLLSERSPDVADQAILAESLSTAFLLLLQNLTPVERAVFLLREVFNYEYPEIARIVDKSEANCRQMVRRSHQHLAKRRPRFEVSPIQHEQMLDRFVQACSMGDMNGLLNLLAEDIVLYTDGGGKVHAALHPIYGPDRVARFMFGIIRKTFNTLEEAYKVLSFRLETINGVRGLVFFLHGQPYATFTLDLEGERIKNIYFLVNPDKLQSIPPSRPNEP